MTIFRRLSAFSLISLLAASFASGHAEAQISDPAPYSVSRRIEATVRPSFLVDRVVTVDILAGNDETAKQMAEHTVEVNEYFTDFTVLEAFTLKADGRRIAVRPESIIKRDKPITFREFDSFDLDVKVTTIHFPEMAAGDRTWLVAKFTAKRPGTAGGIYDVWGADPAQRLAAMTIRIDAPADMQLQHVAKGFEHRTETKDRRTIHEWSLQSLRFHSAEPESVSVADRGPYVMISSFPDWQAAGQVFCEPAQPLTAVTPEVARLAAEITHGREGMKAHAQAIHEWVVSKIRYTSVVLGLGGVVPRSPDSVIANRYGDCKDHATLMRALLAAKGIASDFALVNAASPTYQSHPLPAPAFDHVIVYIPGLDIYADATAKSLPFGTLPASLYDKPTLRCSERPSTMSRIPGTSAEANNGLVTTDVTLSEDGKVSAVTVVEAEGPAVERIKFLLDDAAKRGAGTAINERLRQTGLSGTAQIVSHSVDDQASQARIELRLSVDDKLLGEGYALPAITGPEILPKPFLNYGAAFPSERLRDFVCIPQSYRQLNTYRLPPGWRAVGLPADLHRKGGPAEYTARYISDGSTVRIERTFALRSAGSVCPAGLASDMAPVYNAAIRDAGQRLGFVRDENVPASAEGARSATAARSGQAEAVAATPPHLGSHKVAWKILPDNDVEAVITTELQAVTGEGAGQLGQRWLFHEPGETLEILEAATLKTDGRRLAVPADKVVSRAIGKSRNMQVILFPDVSEGDRVRYTVRRRKPQGAMPGGFVLTAGFNADPATAEFTATLDAPAHLPLRISARGFQQNISTANGVTRYEWKAEPLPYHPSHFDELSVTLNRARSLSISSYPDWDAAGEAYCGPANETTARSPEIDRLADEITAGLSGEREQAAAIIDWVAAKIADNDVSLNGGWVPAMPSAVASIRRGSSNDRAALARALLAAKGVEAHYVLADGARVFADSEVPSLDFGQVLLYLPAWNVYTDPSNPIAGFGVLEDGQYGTQALRCGPGKPKLTRLPHPVAEENSASVTTQLTVGEDGKAVGKIAIIGKGSTLAEFRRFRNDLALKGADAVLDEKLTATGLRGSAKLAPSPSENGAINLAVAIEDPLLGEDNARRVFVGPRIVASPFQEFEGVLRADRETPFFCFPKTHSETVVYTLPKGWTAKDLPKDIMRNGGPAEYRASYQAVGNRIEVDRSFALRSSSSICLPEIASEILPVIREASRDQEARLTFVTEQD